ncbi:MAG TPA: tetratricopeptide repeat protein, partial [Candidatus Deferrimicrobiaceae bacterium]
WWPLGRFPRFGAPGVSRSEALGAAWGLVREKIPLFALSAASSIVTYVVQDRASAIPSSTFFPLDVRLSNAAVSWAKYLGRMLWPPSLATYYPHPGDTLPAWHVAGAVVLLSYATVLFVRWLGARGYTAVGWLWFLGTLVPVIGIVQVGAQAMADRYAYVPSVGIFLLAVWGISDLAAGRKESVPGVPAIAGALAILAVLSILTWRQTGYWKDTVTLFRRTLEVTGNNCVAHNVIGETLLHEGGDVPGAEAHFRAALRSFPDYADANFNLGLLLLRKGDFDGAEEHLERTVRAEPGRSVAHYNLGTIRARRGDLPRAAADFREALSHRPELAEAHYNLGLVLEKQGEREGALHHYREAARLQPEDSMARNNLGAALARGGRAEESLQHFREAVRLDPGNAVARYNLALSLLAMGRREEANAEYGTAVRLRPGDAEMRRRWEAMAGGIRR